MPKTANLKNKKPAFHSRAARRATSPSIDVDRSLKIVKPPPESVDHRPSVLAIHHGAGVSKKAKKGRVMSAKARKRQEKGLEKAELFIDRMEKKIEKSVTHARTVKARRAPWTELNEQAAPQAGNTKKSKDLLKTNEFANDTGIDHASDDVQMDTTTAVGQPVTRFNDEEVDAAASVALPDDGEIL